MLLATANDEDSFTHNRSASPSFLQGRSWLQVAVSISFLPASTVSGRNAKARKAQLNNLKLLAIRKFSICLT